MTPYACNINKSMFKQIKKVVSIAVLAAFISTSVKSPVFAQSYQTGEMPFMSVPGSMVQLSPEFTPDHLQGITIHPENALQFDFLIHQGDGVLSIGQKEEEYTKLVRYFLASLTIPDDNQWVNLSPYEKNRIIKDDFGKTEMGRDLLAQDYMLKQITSSLIYPENGLGKKFWDMVFDRAWKEYHTTDIPVNTFNKVWIMPDQAYVYESGNSAYILQSHLKVMLEEDYLSLKKHTALAEFSPSAANDSHAIGSKVIRQIILPELEKEVNTGKNFANLRQMYSGMILATWYKQALKESLLGKVYADRAKVQGVNQDPKNNEIIYKRYLKAFKKGVFNYIKEDVDKYTNEPIPRKYFSGGFQRRTGDVKVFTDPAMLPAAVKEKLAIEFKDNAANEGRVEVVTINLNSVNQASGAKMGNVSSAGSKIVPSAKTTASPNAAMTAKTVFVIDDDPMQLELMEAVLAGQGYTILIASKPETAREVWRGHKEKIDLIISDTNRPGGLWTEEVSEFKKDKNVPVLAVSGLEGPEAWKGITEDFVGKPYRVEELVAKVKSLLPDAAMVTAADREVVRIFLASLGKTINRHDQGSAHLGANEVGVTLRALGGVDRSNPRNLVPIANPFPVPSVQAAIEQKTDFLLGKFFQDNHANKLFDQTSIEKVRKLIRVTDTGRRFNYSTTTAGSSNGNLYEFEAAIYKIDAAMTADVEEAKTLAMVYFNNLNLIKRNTISSELRSWFNNILSEIDRHERYELLSEQIYRFKDQLKKSISRSGGNPERTSSVLAALEGSLTNLERVYENQLNAAMTVTSQDISKFNNAALHPVAEDDTDSFNIGRLHQIAVSAEDSTLRKAAMGELQNEVNKTGSTVDEVLKNPDRVKALVAEIFRSTMSYELKHGKKSGVGDQATVAETPLGGIDLNAANMDLRIKRDGKGVPLPLALQDMNQLMRVQGFVPEIIEIKPAVNLPILSELQQKLQATAV